MASQKARDLWKRLKDEDRENKFCIECNSANPQWASVSYGIFFCLECSGVHRSVGVHLSFVRSLTMDSWTDRQLAMMQAGGNSKAKAFFKAHGIDGMGIKEKYATKPAAQLREKILAQIEGRSFEDDKKKASPTARSTGSAVGSAAGSAGTQKDDLRPANTKQQRDELDDWLDDKPQRVTRSAQPKEQQSKKREEFDWGIGNNTSPAPSSDKPERSRTSESRGNTSSGGGGGSAQYSTPPPRSQTSYSSSQSSYSSSGGAGTPSYNGSSSNTNTYNGNNTERLSQFQNARAISSTQFYGEDTKPKTGYGGGGGYNAPTDSVVDYGFNLISDGIGKLGVVATAAATKITESSRDFSAKVQQKGLLNEVQDLAGKGWDLVGTYAAKAKEQIYAEPGQTAPTSGPDMYASRRGGYGGGNNSNNTAQNEISWDDDSADNNGRQAPPTRQSPPKSRNNTSVRTGDLLGDEDLLGDNGSSYSNGNNVSSRRTNGGGAKPISNNNNNNNNNNTQQKDLLMDDTWAWDDSSKKQQAKEEVDDADTRDNGDSVDVNSKNESDEWVWKDDDVAKTNNNTNKAVRKTAVAKKKVAATGGDGSWGGWE